MCSDDENEECCCPKKVADRCFVFAVVSLITFCYISYWWLIVIPFKWYASVTGLLNVVCLNTTFTLLCVAYYKTMWTDPGCVEKGWVSMDL